MSGFFDQACRDHGAAHPFVHEAAHAVAAADRGLAFRSVQVLPPYRWDATNDGLLVGGLDPGPDPRSWVRASPRATFEVIISGFLAEKALLGHHLDHAYDGDIKFWRIHMDLTEGLSSDVIENAIGAPMRDVVNQVERWARKRNRCIRAVVSAMSGVDDLSVATQLEFRDDWILDSPQVHALMRQL
ncbi:MAG: hypothetical protein M3198_18425 [Actinomycetota bacterium]|nr:hypothetical protein [Actinomycetota bacterium]